MITKRIEQAKQALSQRGHTFLFTKDPHLLFYLTNIPFSSGFLFLSKKSCHLFVDGRYLTQAQSLAPLYTVHAYTSSQDLPETITKAIPHLKGSLAFCPHHTSYASYTFLEKLPRVHLTADESLFANLRRSKDQHELSLIKKACEITQEAARKAFKRCTKGVTEKEIAFFLKKYFLEQGADSAFEPIVAFGTNSACPHWQPSDTPFSTQSVVLIDCGAKWNKYCSDMTRVFFPKKPPKSLQKAFKATLKAYEASAKYAKPGVSASSVFECALDALKTEGIDNIPHGLGHGVGLEIHEAPSLKPISTDVFLQTRDVITIEPGVYLPNIGGIRLENTLLVEKTGVTSLMDLEFDL